MVGHIKLHYIMLVILSLTGVMMILIATRWGIGINPDSVTYLNAAQNIAEGKGYIYTSGSDSIPISHYPPFYSVVLVIIYSIGLSLPVAARYLNTILFGANIFLTGLVTDLFIPGLTSLSIIVSFFMVTSLSILQTHSSAMSEPLFIFLEMIGFLFLGKYFENSRSINFIAVSLAFGLSFVTRYLGVSIIITGFLGILFYAKLPARRKFTQGLFYGLISLIPILIFIVRNLLLSGSATDRSFTFHPISYLEIKAGLSTISKWILPGDFPPSIRMIVLTISVLGLVASVIIEIRRFQKENYTSNTIDFARSAPGWIGCLILFIFLFLLALLGSISFFDYNTPLNNRILSPIFPPALILIMSWIGRVEKTINHKVVFRVIAIPVFVIYAGLSLYYGIQWVSQSSKTGLEYASKSWQRSETMKQVRMLPADVLIYTNAPDAIEYYSKRPTRLIPSKIDPVSGQINEHYNAEWAQINAYGRKEDVVIVYFHTVTWRTYLPEEQEVIDMLPLRLIFMGNDGSIYQFAFP